MTAQRFRCPAAVYFRDPHMVVDDRDWKLTDSAGVEVVVCLLACIITVACCRLPADVEVSGSEPAAGEAA